MKKKPNDDMEHFPSRLAIESLIDRLTIGKFNPHDDDGKYHDALSECRDMRTTIKSIAKRITTALKSVEAELKACKAFGDDYSRQRIAKDRKVAK